MVNSMFIRKAKKMIKDPNMFFYDYFKKKLGDKIIVKSDNPSEMFEFNYSIDISDIMRGGVAKYICDKFNGGCCVKSNDDFNSIAFWSGHLNLFISFLNSLCRVLSYSIKIYTLNGGYKYEVGNGNEWDIKKIIRGLAKRTDFVIELSNGIDYSEIFNIYLYDINTESIVTMRSKHVLAKKFHINDINVIYNNPKANVKKVDVVYTWVNQTDIDWQELWMKTFPEQDFDPDRFTDNDELKYSLRSINKYAPWVNRIFIVSNCRPPEWLGYSSKIEWVYHEDIYPREDMLPTFNSHSIECCLHRIKGLSEFFIYFNDDVVLGQPCLVSDFFDDIGRSISYWEPYGMVYEYSSRSELPDYMKASINSSLLLKSVESGYNARNLMKHVPHALRKSVLEEVETLFSERVNETRYSKVRGDGDINLTSFLYHHYSILKGLSIKGVMSDIIVRPSNIKKVVSEFPFSYKVMCFNDGGGSAENKSYKTMSLNYLSGRLPEKATWEK
ncbi:stealth conserved region 3 domain-containing protein [Kluyvera sp. STS39-E]|uniref:stealth conserved region 3 domain-containing protein n=1 Tax=Kluyvera sp. STS39-E TaxID=3234748 RepID=UPI0034C5FF52